MFGQKQYKMQEYLTTYEKTNKAGNTYYTQEVEYGIKGEEGYELMWSGKVGKAEWEWSQMIAKEQPERVIMNEHGIICLKN